MPLAVSQLEAFFKKGGQILFGTDIGYITESDPAEEYELMARAGMSFREILASLTTVPSSDRSGGIVPSAAGGTDRGLEGSALPTGRSIV